MSVINKFQDHDKQIYNFFFLVTYQIKKIVK